MFSRLERGGSALMDNRMIILDMITKPGDINLPSDLLSTDRLLELTTPRSVRDILNISKIHSFCSVDNKGDGRFNFSIDCNSKLNCNISQEIINKLNGEDLYIIPPKVNGIPELVELPATVDCGNTVRDSALARSILPKVLYSRYHNSVMFNCKKFFKDDYLNIFARAYLDYGSLSMLIFRDSYKFPDTDKLSDDTKLLLSIIKDYEVRCKDVNIDNILYLKEVSSEIHKLSKLTKELKRENDKLRISYEKRIQKMYSASHVKSLLDDRDSIISQLRKEIKESKIVEREVIKEVKVIVDNTVIVSDSNFTDDYNLSDKKCMVIVKEENVTNISHLNSIFKSYQLYNVDDAGRVSTALKSGKFDYIIYEISYTQHTVPYSIKANKSDSSRVIPVKGLNASKWIPQIYKSLYKRN